MGCSLAGCHIPVFGDEGPTKGQGAPHPAWMREELDEEVLVLLSPETQRRTSRRRFPRRKRLENITNLHQSDVFRFNGSHKGFASPIKAPASLRLEHDAPVFSPEALAKAPEAVPATSPERAQAARPVHASPVLRPGRTSPEKKPGLGSGVRPAVGRGKGKGKGKGPPVRGVGIGSAVRSVGLGVGNSTSTLKPLFWSKVSQTEAALWTRNETAIDVGTQNVTIEDIVDTRELELNFCREAHVCTKPAAPKQPVKVTLVPHQRSQNIGILLARWKLSFSEIRLRIEQFDTDFLTAHRLAVLSKCCPTPEEEELIREYEGNPAELGLGEKFFVEMIKIERLRPRLAVMEAMSCFEDAQLELSETAEVLEVASREVVNSRKLAQLLHLILRLGNTLNEGTTHGGAMAFRMESLLKLSSLWSTDKRTTFLKYLVQTVESKVPSLMNFNAEMPHMGRASEIEPKQLEQGRHQLSMTIDSVREEADLSGPEQHPHYRHMLLHFLKDSEDKMARLNNQINRAVESYLNMLEYFGEVDDATNLFQTLVKFQAQFQAEKCTKSGIR